MLSELQGPPGEKGRCGGGVEPGYLPRGVFTSCSPFLGGPHATSTAVLAPLCFQLLYSAALLHSCQAALYRAMKEQRPPLRSRPSPLLWDELRERSLLRAPGAVGRCSLFPSLTAETRQGVLETALPPRHLLSPRSRARR